MEWSILDRLNLPPVNWAPAQAAVEKLLGEVGLPEAQMSVALIDDEEMRDLNRRWRGIDRSTDVLSWPQSEPGEAPSAVLGDVAISYPTALRQAQARGWALEEEIALLLVHGTLHLLGHEDDTEDGAQGMQAIETRLLGRPLDRVITPHS